MTSAPTGRMTMIGVAQPAAMSAMGRQTMSSSSSEKTTLGPISPITGAMGRQTMSGASTTMLSALMMSNSITVGRQAMTTGTKSTKGGDESPTQMGPSPSGDHAAWAAGEWAIVGGRRPAKRARPRVQHTASVAAHRGAAWAAGEWAMPEGTTKERD